MFRFHINMALKDKICIKQEVSLRYRQFHEFRKVFSLIITLIDRYSFLHGFRNKLFAY